MIDPQPPSRSSYDLVVVGAGIVGLACAWRAARSGRSVAVLDRDRPGAGASGVAAGMLAPATEADFGDEDLLALNIESRRLWPGFAAELEEATALPTGYEDRGALVVAADRDDAEELRRLHAFQVELGLEATWLSSREARRLEGGLSPRIGGAILAPQDGQADPPAVVAALERALRCGGADVLGGQAVESLVTTGGRVAGVRTENGTEVAAGAVVIAAGAWSSEGGLATELDGPPVRPVKGQLLELRVRDGRPAVARHLIRTPRCYLVSRADGRVVLGATTEDEGFDTTITADGVYRLLEAAYEVLPDVAELELVRARAGLRPGSPANMPTIGPGAAEGLIWATGHGRNGVLLAPLTARAVLELLDDGRLPEVVRPFDRASGAS